MRQILLAIATRNGKVRRIRLWFSHSHIETRRHLLAAVWLVPQTLEFGFEPIERSKCQLNKTRSNVEVSGSTAKT
jgi:hypothetical protein